MVRGQKKHVLSPTELENLKEERREIEETKRNLEHGDGAGTKATSIDRAALDRQDRVLRDAIDRGSPDKISGVRKDKMASESEALESQIKEGMPTRDEMRDPQRYPGAVRKHMMWESKNIHKVEQWKQMQRKLNPGDPTCSSVERLRREK